MSFLNLTDKVFYIAGVANKKSVAYFVAKTLEAEGAKLVFSAQNDKNFSAIEKLFPNSPVFLFDVEKDEDIKELASKVTKHFPKIDGFLHSIAFANFSTGPKAFYEVEKKDYLQAAHISSFSFAQMSGALKDVFNETASAVTISISSTKATSYGYLGPIKAMLESSVNYLAKSFSEFSNVRFNSIAAGPLKTSASAGIPDYLENYFYAESLTLRKKALQTQEVANTVTFLLSERASGINASSVLVDAGMNCNYFDQDVVKTFVGAKY
jgi:enoyl-[acyl-carrier protein] reductase I